VHSPFKTGVVASQEHLVVVKVSASFVSQTNSFCMLTLVIRGGGLPSWELKETDVFVALADLLRVWWDGLVVSWTVANARAKKRMAHRKGIKGAHGNEGGGGNGRSCILV